MHELDLQLVNKAGETVEKGKLSVKGKGKIDFIFSDTFKVPLTIDYKDEDTLKIGIGGVFKIDDSFILSGGISKNVLEKGLQAGLKLKIAIDKSISASLEFDKDFTKGSNTMTASVGFSIRF